MRLVIIGGSDAGIQAGLRATERDPAVAVTVLVADRYPNYSVCGIPYHVAGEVADWHDLAHRSRADLAAAGLDVRLRHRAVRIDPAAKQVDCLDEAGDLRRFGYDQLVVATGALPARPPIGGLEELGPDQGVHTLHTIGDTLALTASLTRRHARQVVIVGAGYIGMEMAEALRTRGLGVTVLERLPQVLPATIDADLSAQLEVTPGCRLAPPPTSRAASPARPPPAGTGSSPGRSAPRSCASSTGSSPRPGCAMARRPRPGSTRSPSGRSPTTTTPTTRARPPCRYG
jgi:NAD(P)H-nitrite reductase large subunit